MSDDTDQEFRQFLAQNGLPLPDLIEKIGAVGDERRTAEIAMREALIESLALRMKTEWDVLQRGLAESLIQTATDKEALERHVRLLLGLTLEQTLGRVEPTP